MRVRINGCLLHLPSLTEQEIQRLLDEAGDRIAAIRDEVAQLAAERGRRHAPDLGE